MSGSVAKRYATALIEVAREMNKVDEIGQELEDLQQLFISNPALHQVLESPAVSNEKKKAIYAEIKNKFSKTGFFKNWIRFGKEKSNEDSGPVDNLLKILIDRNRMTVFPMLARLYQDLADEANGRVRVEVSSAVELGEQTVSLKNLLQKRFGNNVILETKIDPSILGGMVVKAKDVIFDASLRGDLMRMKERILEKI
ncbi:MAG: ATP synthase F1 subunit delta [Deltaproteobacteria bacterium]|nr:ATP synthase F1 subunit delta [Deltaproteobacteria bacterium]